MTFQGTKFYIINTPYYMNSGRKKKEGIVKIVKIQIYHTDLN